MVYLKNDINCIIGEVVRIDKKEVKGVKTGTVQVGMFPPAQRSRRFDIFHSALYGGGVLLTCGQSG
jgi:hypothetical protein